MGNIAITKSVWDSMIRRCVDENRKNHYGKGIKVCDRWKDFLYFFIDMGERPSLSHSLDRINNTIGYHSWNCRWTTAAIQSHNRSSSNHIKLQSIYAQSV